MLRQIVDALAEASVVGSYSKLGYRLRAPTFAPLPDDVHGKVVVVTGGNSGIGFAAARALASRNARVILVGRDPAKLAAAVSTIPVKEHPVTTEVCDLSDLVQVLALSARLPTVDVLVHNAGLLVDERALSAQGEEMGFAVHVLAPYLLTRKLEDRLSSTSRVLWVTSGGMYTQHLDLDRCRARSDEEAGSFDGVVAYAQQKRAQVILNELFAARLAPRGIRSNAMHPGWAKTPGVDRGLPVFTRVMAPLLRSAEEGADTLVWLAVGNVDATGQLFLDRAARKTEVVPGTRHSDDEKRALWDLCASITGVV